ncbi:MAG TPA: hypothetical protein VFT84_02495 [Gemmatimonadales bacterium]|nr:hypothetical protein [Gemmatimonadales bacterium]
MRLGLLLALLLQQPGPPTVGDTLWLRYEVPVPAGRSVRAADWIPEDPVELLGPPRVVVRGGSAEIAYPVVVWRAGSQVVRAPGPLLLGPDGGVDSLPARVFTLTISSVLPVERPDTGLRPQPRAEFVARGVRSLWPPVVAVLLAAVLLAPLHWWWRRRGTPRPHRRSETFGPGAPPFDRWADAGESRAVAAAATGRLRAVLARRAEGAHPALDTETVLAHVADVRPLWPHAELGDLLRSLDEARFGHRTFPDAIGLARWAAELEPRLQGERTA